MHRLSDMCRNGLFFQHNRNCNSLLMKGTKISDLITISGDVHHIFPKAYLKKNGVTNKTKYNQVANYIYLDTQVNKAISDDAPATYWFALFHELGHVLQQRIKVLLVSETKKAGLEMDALIQRLEAEADAFSQNTLIPKAEYDEFVMMCSSGFTAEAIRHFATRINVLPGIVVGRLQHDGYLTNKTTLNSLKIKYVIG